MLRPLPLTLLPILAILASAQPHRAAGSILLPHEMCPALFADAHFLADVGGASRATPDSGSSPSQPELDEIHQFCALAEGPSGASGAHQLPHGGGSPAQACAGAPTAVILDLSPRGRIVDVRDALPPPPVYEWFTPPRS